MKHKHYDLIITWANGAKIEYFHTVCQQWFEDTHPLWNENLEYRVKPVKPKKTVIKYRIALQKANEKYFISHWSTNNYQKAEKEFSFVKWLTDEQIVNIKE
jgi:hypothetical protein